MNFPEFWKLANQTKTKIVLINYAFAACHFYKRLFHLTSLPSPEL